MNIDNTYAVNTQSGSGKPWRQQYAINNTQSGDITGWTADTTLPSGLRFSQAIVTSSRVYLLGGSNGGWVSTVYTAPINSDGTLGTWTTGTSLPGALAFSQAIVTSSRVYLLGGYNGRSYVSTVYTAPINSDGTLGTWTTGTSLPGALVHSQAIVTSSRVYLLGGHDGSNYVSTVYTAPFSGGSNDYSPYYNGTYPPTTPGSVKEGSTEDISSDTESETSSNKPDTTKSDVKRYTLSITGTVDSKEKFIKTLKKLQELSDVFDEVDDISILKDPEDSNLIPVLNKARVEETPVNT